MKKMSVKMVTLLGAGLIAIPLLAACGGPKTINVTETEDFHMQLDNTSARAGEITFHITNDATDMVHEFVVVKSDLGDGDLPLGDDGNVDEDQINHLDEQEDIQPGESRDLVITLEPGNYVLMCNLPDHYGKGMHAAFTVTP
jgi:uncharacterized cupredoxin-like copper-binding protein